ncbi:hypothetical protein GCM10025868_43400 [Angustibacter aerolatus]|uniref:AMP-dependent synthetase/ligase domain-containing protein n=1 Tax=Angustibacter aerolatus TaxID=1162965 RepID=A0ABQ6JP92_9ACTN|nr:hypothetical protein [Angustibacter aerolatus]GMA89090.1 hypothetical protein GCM10025868_43400 [Angustibacter aerolatus]
MMSDGWVAVGEPGRSHDPEPFVGDTVPATLADTVRRWGLATPSWTSPAAAGGRGRRLGADVDRFARALVADGVRPGDRVAL